MRRLEHGVRLADTRRRAEKDFQSAAAAAAALGDDPGPLVLPGGMVAAVDTLRTALAVRRSTRSA
jgi:hypothetical protein